MTDFNSPGQIDWHTRFNYAWSTSKRLSQRGWSFDMTDEENLTVRTVKGAGIDQQDYHWRLLESADWHNFRDFVKYTSK